MKTNAILFYFFKLYSLLWWIALPLLRNNFRLKQGIKQRTSSNHFKKADVWIQAASAGEAYLAVEIINKLSPAKKTKTFLTSTTSQGMDILKNEISKDLLHPNLEVDVSWFPFDIPKLMDKAVLKIKPKIMILLESEIWPGLLYSLKKQGIKTFIINGRISNKSFKNYMRTSFIWKPIAPDKVFATTHKYQKRFIFASVFNINYFTICKMIKSNNSINSITRHYYNTFF